MADTAFFDTPEWFKATPDEQTSILDQKFASLAEQSLEYQNSDEAGKANMRLAYQALVEERAEESEFNSRARDAADAQRYTNVADFGTTTAQAVGRSMDQGKDVLLMAPEILSGNFGEGFGRSGAAYYQKMADAPQTATRKKVDADIAKWRKSYDHAGDWAGKASAWGQLVADIITNPAGVIEFGAESSSSLAAYWAGAKVGGAAAAGVTAVTGGAGAAAAPFITAGGMWASASAQAASMKFLEKLQEGMQAEKLEMLPANIQMFVKNNPEAIAAWREESIAYGAAMGGVDVALGAVASRFASAPVRAAQRTAAAAAKADSGLAARLGQFVTPEHSLEDLTKDYITGEAQKILAAQTFKSKLGRKAGSYAGELISEPTSEASGLLASGEEIKAEDLIAETIGGIGMGPIGAAINTGAMGTKLAKNITGEFKNNLFGGGKKEVDPNDPIAVAKQQNQAPVERNYKQKVAETDINAPEVTAWADPKDKANYNPVKAAAVLAKGEDHETLSRIKTIENDLLTEIFAAEEQQIKKSAEFAKLKEAGLENSAQGTALATEMMGLADANKERLKTFNQVNQHSQALTTKLQEAGKQKTVTPVDVTTATTPEVTKHILESLGSSDMTNSMPLEDLEKAKALPDATEESNALIDLTIKGRILKKNIQDSAMNGKSADEVAKDVYHGLAKSPFKGIDSYLSAIATAAGLQHNSVVKTELRFLSKFRDAHKQKHEDTKALFEIFKKDGDKVKEDPRYIRLKAANSNFFVDPRTQKLLAMEAMEVEALDNAVEQANSLVAAGKVSTEATTPTKTPKALVANPPASTTPAAVTPALVVTLPVAEERSAKLTPTEPKATPKPKGRSLFVEMIAAGGLTRDAFTTGLDRNLLKEPGARRITKNGKMTLEQLAQAMYERGWDVPADDGKVDENAFADMIRDELGWDSKSKNPRPNMHPEDADSRLEEREGPIDTGVIIEELAKVNEQLRRSRGTDRRQPTDPTKLYAKQAKLAAQLTAALEHNEQFEEYDTDEQNIPVEENGAPTEEYDAALESLVNIDDQYGEDEQNVEADGDIDTDEVIDSTEADNADNMAGVSSAYGLLKVTYNDVIDGEVSENYQEAKEKLKIEIKECEAILRCFKGK